jgi:hypothetical protein
MNSWEQQPGESARAFSAAQIYFHAGPGRSLAQVAQELSKSVQLIKRWSSKHNWVERAAAYDAHMAEVEQSRLEEEVRRQAEEKAAEWNARLDALREREWATSEAIIRRVETMLKFPIEQQEIVNGEKGTVTIIKPIKWTGSDMGKLALAASKLGRLATGAETDRTASVDVGELSNEELERVAKTGRL